MQTFRLFVASPGDVSVERRRVENVVSCLNGEFAGEARLEAIRWETKFYQAFSTFQAQIPSSTDCDLVIGILKWRLGTELPPEFAEKLPDGRPFPSGTAYEILTAIEKRQKGAELPDIYVFRFVGSSPSIVIEDPDRGEIEHDWQMLKGFFQEWFVTERGHFKAAFNTYGSEDDFETQLDRLLRKWVADRVAGGRVVRWPIEVMGSPFCGLAAFGAKHAPVFFGRSQDINRAVELWRVAGRRGSPYLLIVGASGAGKSSLARAGLLPRLTTPGVIKEVDAWRVAVMRPGDSPGGPFAGLSSALMVAEAGLPKEEEGRGPALPEIGQGDSQTPADLAAVLRHADAAAIKPIVNALARVGAAERDREHYDRPVRCDLVLLVDQLEELFAASVSESERGAFIDLLAAMIATGRVWVAMTLRADFYARMLDQPVLKRLKELGVTYDLAPPGPVELAGTVRGPAEAAGLVFDTDPATGERLDSRLLRDADRPDMLPLVQLALARVFEGRESVGGEIRLPLKVYESLGGLKGIIDEAGETALAQLEEAEKVRLPSLLRQLAVPANGPDGRGKDALTIRSVPVAQAAPDYLARKLLNTLVAARLLTVSGIEADAQVRLAHQRVLEDWTRARTIVRDSADFYRVRADLDESRRRWEMGKRRRELLLARGLPLAEAESIVSKYGDELRADAVSYVKASRKRANQGKMIAWGAAGCFFFVAIAAVGAGKIAFDQRTQAERQRDTALITQSRFLANLAGQQRDAGDAGTALLLALEALQDDVTETSRPYVVDAELQLDQVWRALRERAILGTDTYNVAFSPDGMRVVTASDDNTARLWDATTGKPVGGPLVGHTDAVLSAAFSPDGMSVVTASRDRTARLWDVRTGEPIGRPLAGHTDAVVSAAFSPDGKRILTVSSDKTVRLWDVESSQQIGPPFTGEESAALSPDGRRVVTVSDREARIWDVETGQQIGEPLDTFLVHSAAFSPDGKRIVTALDNGIAELWDAETGQQIDPWRVEHEDPTGRSTPILFDAEFSPDGTRVVTASADKTARVWDATTGHQIGKPLTGHTDSVWNASFSSDGKFIITASADGTARLWDAESGMQIGAPFRGHIGALRIAALSSDGGHIVTESDDGTARLWDTSIEGGEPLAAESDSLRSAAFSPDGKRIATALENATVQVWDVRTRQKIGMPLLGHASFVSSATFSPDGMRIVTASGDTTAQLWDAETDQPIGLPLAGHTGAVLSAAFSPNGRRIVTASADKTARVWDATTGKQIGAPLTGHTGDVVSAAFSPNGKRIVTASSDKTARLWDAESGKQIGTSLVGHTAWLRSAAFSPDGRRIVTAAYDDTARLWDAETGKPLGEPLLGHTDAVTSAAFSPDGKRIVTTSLDETARLWDAETEQLVSKMDHRDLVEGAAFSPDGTLLVTLSGDNAWLWDIFTSTKQLIAAARAQIPRCLTTEQRKIFFLPPEPPAWCIEMEKWPYQTAAWKQWLADTRAGKKPQLPSAP